MSKRRWGVLRASRVSLTLRRFQESWHEPPEFYLKPRRHFCSASEASSAKETPHPSVIVVVMVMVTTWGLSSPHIYIINLSSILRRVWSILAKFEPYGSRPGWPPPSPCKAIILELSISFKIKTWVWSMVHAQTNWMCCIDFHIRLIGSSENIDAIMCWTEGKIINIGGISHNSLQCIENLDCFRMKYWS